MPTIVRIDGMRVMIYFNDHPPAHVHIVGAGGENAEFWLNCPNGPPSLRANYGMSNAQLTRIGTALTGALNDLCNRWEEIHGPY